MFRRQAAETRTHFAFIGPVFVVVLIIAGYLIWRENTGDPVRWPPAWRGPSVERHVVPGTRPDKTPTPDYVLQHVREMDLPAKSRDALEKLSRQSAEQLQPLKAQVDRAKGDFRSYMNQRQREGRTVMGDLQQQIDKADDAFARADEAVKRYWQQAGTVLTPEQKAQVERKYQEDRKKAQ